MLTILHAADFHLDSPFRALPLREAQQRRAGQRKALEQLRDLALERQVDLALFPGDLFDSQEVYPETVETLIRVLGQFPCPVVIAPGNHDFYDGHSPYAKPIWPDNVSIFSAETVSSFAFPALGVTVYGYAFTSPFLEDDPLAGFHAADDGTLAIGCFHGDVDAAQSRYAPIAKESLAQSGLAYAALGHVHAPSGLQSGTTPWAYPGCIQGRGFDELGRRGACLVQVGQGPAALEFCPLAGPRYWERTACVQDGDSAQAVSDALSDVREEDYVRLTLTGECPALDLPALQTLGEGLCRVFQLRDETAPPLELWARAQEDTLTGHFLREMRTRLDSASEADRPLVEMALRCGMAALEGRDTPLW